MADPKSTQVRRTVFPQDAKYIKQSIQSQDQYKDIFKRSDKNEFHCAFIILRYPTEFAILTFILILLLFINAIIIYKEIRYGPHKILVQITS